MLSHIFLSAVNFGIVPMCPGLLRKISESIQFGLIPQLKRIPKPGPGGIWPPDCQNQFESDSICARCGDAYLR